MKKFVAFLSLWVFGISAQASILESFFQSERGDQFCAKAMRPTGPSSWATYRPNFVQVGETLIASARERIEDQNVYSIYRFTEEGEELLYRTGQRIFDITADEDFLWIALWHEVLKIDLVTRTEERISFVSRENAGTWESRIHGLHLDRSTLYIAHGTNGLFMADQFSNRVIGRNPLNLRQTRHISKASSIGGYNGNLYITMSPVTVSNNDRDRPFAGILTFFGGNTQNFQRAAFDYRRSGTIASEYFAISRDYFFLNNMGTLQIIDRRRVERGEEVHYEHQFLQRSIDGRRLTGLWIGSILADGNSVYGCADFPHQDSVTRRVTRYTLAHIHRMY